MHRVKKRKLPTVQLRINLGGRYYSVKAPLGPGQQSIPEAVASTFVHLNDGDAPETCKPALNDQPLHQVRKEHLAAQWGKCLGSIMSASIEGHFPASFICSVCQKEDKEIILCTDCFPAHYYCSDCFGSSHDNNLLHQGFKWSSEDNMFKLFEGKVPLIQRMGHEKCPYSYTKIIVVVDKEGYQHQHEFQFCTCEEEAVTLTRHMLWPSTPTNPGVAFHFSLLENLRMLVVECQLSIHGFFEALKWKTDGTLKNTIIVKELYRCVTGECFEMYRRFAYERRYLRNLCPDYDDGTDCPACPPQGGKRIYSFDANFGLVRKRSAGNAVKQPFHTGHFFLPQEDVDRFVDTYKSSTADKGCADFQAGSDLRAKNKSSKLAETGVFGACCRHEFPKKFFNLRHGERLSNAVFLLKYLAVDNNHEQFTVLYDIACKLRPHIQHIQELGCVQLGIPIFHCYGHNMSCQINFSTRQMEGIGLTDGETMERLWSFFRRFKKITKEMQDDHRHDLLVDGLLHYGTKLKRRMMPYLCQRFEKASRGKDLYAEELKILVPFASDEEISGWVADERKQMEAQKTVIETGDKWKEDYALKLHDLSQLQENNVGQASEELVKLETSLNKIERRHSIADRWSADQNPELLYHLCSSVEHRQADLLEDVRCLSYEHLCLKQAMKKYADGQAIAQRLSRQMKSVTGKIGKQCTSYNSLPPVPTRYPNQVNKQDVMSFDSDLWQEVNDIQSVQKLTVTRKAISLLHLKNRSKEELILVKEEMVLVINNHLDKLGRLDRFQMSLLGSDSSQLRKGSQAVTKQHMYMLINVVFDMIQQVKGIVNTDSFTERLQMLSVSCEHPMVICQPYEVFDVDSDSDDD